MKNKIIYLMLAVLISSSSFLHAQPSDSPIQVIDGVEYYVYTVKAGEGLYSISRRFGVTQADINNANPQIHDGLKAGQDILIPKKDEKNIDSSPQILDDIEYVLHTVERRQTLFAISRKYDVSQDVIIQSNPALRERGIQPGDVLRIPVAKKHTVEPSAKPAAVSVRPEISERTLHIGADETYITHSVAQGETLYSISRRYNVSINELKKLNPDAEKGLMAGSMLKIPFRSGISADSKTIAEPVPAAKPREPKTSYKVAYLLPFMQNDQKDATAEKFIEFYMGALLAANNTKNGDMSFEIYAFDTEKTETKIHEIINKPEVQDMDLIIGPAYTAQIPILADFAKRHQIYTVIPFSSKAAHVQENPYLFQFNPDQETQNEFIVNLLKNNFRNAQIIFVKTGNARWSEDGMEFFDYLKQRLDRQRITYSTISSSMINSNFSASLTPDRKNIFIFDTDEYQAVQANLATLHDASAQFDVGVLGQYSWRNYIGKKPKMYYVSPFAGNKLGTQFYEQEFKKYYGDKLPIINPRFDILGYDITTYFLSQMKRDGFTFDTSRQPLTFNRGVQSNFEFQRSGRNGGFVNKKLYLIEDEAVSK